MAISNRYSSMARPDLIITAYPFLIHSVEKGIRKLQYEFDRDRIKSYGHFEPLVKPGGTRSHHHGVSIPHQPHAKGHLENSSNSLIAIQRRIKSYGHFELLLKPGATRPHHHRVSIPHPRHAKGHPETPVRF